ncbi:hypothetical protein H2508_02225 [Parahaliea sp. F7430]|uniref:Uncharacterized protein n=1 Tax=Sediminihaliea albiluteola TaxID=2758564 RepID=A0A7W2TU36_9GAMM|nr:hypothetical protein [Sediminihaliea albiluteola]MBA6411926.1 hypothetical protein [Sediminihaliea albiluteola]
MAQYQNQSIPRDQFLVMSVNLLHKAFLESTRTHAKRVFKEIAEGKIVHMTNVQMEDRSTVRFDLSLDYSEFPGKLNFGSFRNSLVALIAQLSESLRAEKDIAVFTAENDANVMIFGESGITTQDGEPSVLVLGAEVASGQPSVMLRLMYLDYRQFLASPEGQQSAAAEAGQSAGS